MFSIFFQFAMCIYAGARVYEKLIMQTAKIKAFSELYQLTNETIQMKINGEAFAQ
jgi:hypothetical protein